MTKYLKLLATIAALGLSVGVAHAADAAMAAPTTQQSKMKSCNVDAKTKALKGAERKTFMKDCLSAKPAGTMDAAATAPAAAPANGMTPQQNKMKTCNADAKTKALKGVERKAFMKDCLSAK
jgi:hypothetical protein